MAINHNLTERRRAEAALQARTQQLEAVRGVSEEITRELDLPTLLGLITKRAIELVGADSGSVSLWDETAQLLSPWAWHGYNDWIRTIRLRPGEGVAGTVAQRREGLIVNDYRTSPYVLPVFLERTETAAVLAEPLLYRDRLVGVITINRNTAGRPFTEEDSQTLGLFAKQAAIAIENAHLFEHEQTRGRNLEAIRLITEEITKELDLTPLLSLILRRGLELVGATSGTIFLWDEGEQVLIPHAWHGSYPWLSELRLGPGEGVAGTAAEKRRGMIVNDYRRSPFATPFLLEHSTHTAVLAEPFLYHDHLLGVIAINNEGTDRHFSEQDQKLLTLLAAQAAIAIENARLHDATARRARQFAILNNLTRVMTKALDPQALARKILTAAEILIPSAAGRLWNGVQDDGELHFVAGFGLRDPRGGAVLKVRSQEGLPGIAAATRQPVISREVASDPRFINKAWAALEGLVSCIVLPLISGKRVTGALAIYTRVPHDFTVDEVELLQSFAAQAAIAMENARLFAATVRAAREARSLYEVAQSLTTSLNANESLHLIAVRTTELLGTPHAQVALWDEGTQTLRLGAAYGSEAEQVKAQPFRLGEGVNGIVAQTRAALIVNDYQAFPQRVSSLTHLVADIAVPLLYRGRLLGVLNSHATKPGWTFTQEHLALLTSFAAQAAVALENAQLYEERRLAAIQLEATVQDRTRELTEANVRLREASRHKSELLASMSHELRTPLNAVIGFAELLRDEPVGPLTEKQARYLGHIFQSGKHLLQLISDVLDLSKVEAGKIVLDPQMLPLAQTLEDILVIARGLANKKGQEILANTAPDLTFLRAGPVRFKQILFNLLSNAVKFTPDGGTITVTARQVPGTRNQGPIPNPQSPAPNPQPPRQASGWSSTLRTQAPASGPRISPSSSESSSSLRRPGPKGTRGRDSASP